MNLRTVKTIFKKEMLDMARDKRTLIMIVGVPIILYPALFLFATQAAIVQLDKLSKADSRVAFAGEADPDLREWVQAIPMIALQDVPDADDALRRGELDAVVASEPGVADALGQGRSVAVAIRYDATEPASSKAKLRLAEGLKQEQDRLLAERLAAANLSSDYVTPLAVDAENVATPSKTTGVLLGAALPIVFILMLGLGAFYPAVDLTAGEKERGTFETLLSTPTSKMDIVAGKFLTVLCLSITTGLLNLASMTLTLAFQFTQIDANALPFDIHLPPHTVLLLLAVMLPLAFFISALMMSLAMFARTLKEAEYYVTPFLLAILFPAILAAVPGTKLTPVTQFIPITNVTLLFKTLLIETVDAQAVFAVLLSTAAYAGLALLLATWVFQREDLVLSEERGLPITWRRSMFRPRSTPTPGLAMGLFTMTLLLIFYVGSYVQSRQIFAGLIITEWGLILLPTLGLLWYVHVDLRDALQLKRPTMRALIGAFVLGMGWILLVIQIGVWHNKILPIPGEMADEMQRLLRPDNFPFGLPGLLFAVAVSAAVCEELLFRGAILSGLRQVLPPWVAIGVVGLLFGLFHLSLYRLVLTGLSGVVLGYIVFRTRSIFPGMVVHFMVNAFGLLIASDVFPPSIGAFFNEPAIEKQGLPWWILVPALLVFVLGVILLEGQRRTESGEVNR